MYDWPEERQANDAFWSRLRAQSGLDLPAVLTRPADEAALFALWRDPALVFAQTCWGPLSLGLLPALRVLAQPDYSAVPGGRGPFYRSALVARDGQRAAVPAMPGPALPADLAGLRRLAVNARHSMSGWLALLEDAEPLRECVAPATPDERPPAAGPQAPVRRDPGSAARARPGRTCAGRGGLRIVETGGHRASVRAVAEGRADLAAIDCRSWALALRHEPCARRLVVIGWTAERPGLPYVTGAHTDAATADRLRDTLIGMGCHPPQERDG